MSNPEINVPILEKTLANTTINKILVTLFFQNPFNVFVSSPRFSKSLTFGFLIIASTIPANQPAANNGLSDVIGAITKAVRILSGWPNANRVPKALKVPFQRIQDLI